MPLPSTKRRRLQALAEKHGGNLSAIAGAMKISRQAVAAQLRRTGLAGFAASLRVEACISGPRRGDAADPADERRRIVEALRASPTFSAAQDAIGMSRRTFYRKIKTHNIRLEEIRAL